jgi:hypothetical protein
LLDKWIGNSVRKPGKSPLGKLRRRWKGNIKMDLKEIDRG